MIESWQSLILNADAAMYLVNVALAASLAGAAGLVASWLFRRQPAPLRYGLLQVAFVLSMTSWGLAAWSQRTQSGWMQVDVSPLEVPVVMYENLPASLPQAESVPVIDDQPNLNSEMARPTPVPWFRWIVSCLAAIWGLGVVGLACRLIHGIILVSRFRRSLFESENAELRRAVVQAAHALKLRRVPEIRLSVVSPTPLVVGLWRPIIVLPSQLCEEISGAQLEALLLHETAHVARHDQWHGLCERLVGALFWPLPTARLLNRKLAALREDLCDHHVVRTCGSGRALAEVLVHCAETLVAVPAWPAMNGLLEADEDHLTTRVERLLSMKDGNLMTRMNFAAVIATFVFALTLTGAMLVTNLRAAEETPHVQKSSDSKSDSKPGEKPAEKPAEKPGAASAAPDSARKGPPRIEFRWTERKFVGDVTERESVDVSGSDVQLFLHRKPFLTDEDIADTAVGKHNAGTADYYFVDVYLTNSGAKKMAESSAQNLNKPAVILQQGKIISTFTAMTPLADWVLIYGPFPKAEATRIAASIKVAPAPGLEFLKPYPHLYGMSLEMTETKFLEFAKRHELAFTKTEEGDKTEYSLPLNDGDRLLVLFEKSKTRCSRIERLRAS